MIVQKVIGQSYHISLLVRQICADFRHNRSDGDKSTNFCTKIAYALLIKNDEGPFQNGCRFQDGRQSNYKCITAYNCVGHT